MTREYELKRRAEQMEDTRRRIVEAAVDLHQTLGPARTSVSAIAERAGVQRQTYYRHFPEERELFQSCTGHFLAEHPLPDPETWRSVPDPQERLRHGLTELYAYFDVNEEMLTSVLRDAEIHALTQEMVLTYLMPGVMGLHQALAEVLSCDDGDPQLTGLARSRAGLQHLAPARPPQRVASGCGGRSHAQPLELPGLIATSAHH